MRDEEDIIFPMRPNHPDAVRYGEPFALHQQKVVAQAIMAKRLIEADFEISDVHDRMLEQVRYTLSHRVLEEKLVEKEHSAEVTAHAKVSAVAFVTMDFPRSWWQHLKRDHFPAWWKRRWPVKTKQISASRRETATNSNTETVSITFRQYAQFPAAQIHTPSRYRGPILVARESLESTTWPKELS